MSGTPGFKKQFEARVFWIRAVVQGQEGICACMIPLCKLPLSCECGRNLQTQFLSIAEMEFESGPRGSVSPLLTPSLPPPQWKAMLGISGVMPSLASLELVHLLVLPSGGGGPAGMSTWLCSLTQAPGPMGPECLQQAPGWGGGAGRRESSWAAGGPGRSCESPQEQGVEFLVSP